MLKNASSLLLLSAIAPAAAAQDCYPLPASATVTASTEATNPFVVPARITQTLITNRDTLVSAGLTNTLTNWDMVAFSPDARYIFVPCENFGGGGGLFRYDTQTSTFVEIFTGNGQGPGARNNDPNTFDHTTDETAANDPSTWTPYGTVIFGEETTGGRFFELMNPLDATGPWDVRWHASIPAVSHEGMQFDADGNLYFIDESNTGCIYKFVPTVAGDLSAGQTFCLSIDAYANDPNAVPTENFDSASNQLTTRVGAATWVALTGPNGEQITPSNPFEYVTTTGGRTAADEVFGTPFGRPEDIETGFLANGNGVLYAALTSENRVLSIELLTSTTCMVRDYCNYDSINLSTGTDVNPTQQDPFTSPGPNSETNFDDPDNVVLGPKGALYILEDETPGDIWKAVDADGDGVAEHIGLFMSLATTGSEPTGLIFDPTDPYRAICNVQHPASGSDALWSFETRPYPGSDDGLELLTGVGAVPSTGPGEYVRCVTAGDTLEVELRSDSPALAGSFYAIYSTEFPTAVGSLQSSPLWLKRPVSTIGVGFVGGGDDQFTVPVAPGLAGMSSMVQAVAVKVGVLGTSIAYSDAVEVQHK